jgi:signal transduction histidine kinase
MLTRVLAVMMAGVLAVQFANFAVLQLATLPEPPVFTPTQVAIVLRAGRDATGGFRLEASDAPPPSDGPHASELAAVLANTLGVDAARVRVGLDDPPFHLGPIGDGGPPGPPPHGPPGQAHGPPPVEERGGMFVGDFTAALRERDGRWLTARPVRSGLAAWRLRLLFWLVAALVAVAPFAWLLARWVSRPVAVFADAAERIGRDPHTAPLAVGGPAEIAHAARAMNEMQQRLNRYVDDRTVMIGAIAHDLRTPLARLAFRLEQTPEELRHGVARDIADMQAMIAAATVYVRGVTQAGVRRPLDLQSLAESVVDDMVDQGHEVSVLPGGRVVVEGDPVALRAVLDNLVGNALRYGGDAEVSVRAEDERAVVEVRDHGPGLPPDELDRVFEPFFRSEGSRNRDTGGTGLGLASVRGVLNLHGGEAHVSNHADGGLVARIELPR